MELLDDNFEKWAKNIHSQIPKPFFNDIQILLMLLQLNQGISHIFSHNIIHRDLTPPNIMINHFNHSNNNKNDNDECYIPRLVIVDFGCCCKGIIIPYEDDEVSRGGAAFFYPPEIFQKQPGSTSKLDYSRSDIWSAGLMIYWALTGEHPVEYDPLMKLKDNSISSLLSCYSSRVQHIISLMLKVNLQERIHPDDAIFLIQHWLW